MNEGLKDGIKRITPKSIDRREPPNAYLPYFELNISNSKSKF